MLRTPAVTSAAATRDSEAGAGQKDVFLETLRDRLRKGREKQNKVHRYRPGLAPSWVQEEESTSATTVQEAGKDLLEARAEAGRRRQARRAARADDGRMQDDSDGDTRVKRERRPMVAEVVSVSQLRAADRHDAETRGAVAGGGLVIDPRMLKVQDLPSSSSGSDSDSEDSDDRQRRRARARARARQRQQDESSAQTSVRVTQAATAESSSSSSEPSSEEESSSSDSEDEETSRLLLLKPTFIPKGRRVTVAERERIDAEAQAVLEEERRRERELRAEARQAVVEEIQRGSQRQRGGTAVLDGALGTAAQLAATNRDLSYAGGVLRTKEGAELILDSSSEEDSDDELELERWKLRELERLRRDKELRDKEELQQQEMERRRGMTDEEIRAENERLAAAGGGGGGGGDQTSSDQPKMQFMQRYYHKGVFFMDQNEDSELFQRDFSAPTGEDKELGDKSMLPTVMQVKNWGKRGRTKYTHLVDQDTSNLAENPWASRIARHTQAKFQRFRRGSVQP